MDAPSDQTDENVSMDTTPMPGPCAIMGGRSGSDIYPSLGVRQCIIRALFGSIQPFMTDAFIAALPFDRLINLEGFYAEFDKGRAAYQSDGARIAREQEKIRSEIEAAVNVGLYSKFRCAKITSFNHNVTPSRTEEATHLRIAVSLDFTGGPSMDDMVPYWLMFNAIVAIKVLDTGDVVHELKYIKCREQNLVDGIGLINTQFICTMICNVLGLSPEITRVIVLKFPCESELTVGKKNPF